MLDEGKRLLSGHDCKGVWSRVPHLAIDLADQGMEVWVGQTKADEQDRVL
jgi:hypothetical protein